MLSFDDVDPRPVNESSVTVRLPGPTRRRWVNRIVTGIGCGSLGTLIIYALMVSRGPVRLHARLGPAPGTVSQRQSLQFAVLGDVHGHGRSLRDALRQAAERGCAFMVQIGDFVDHDDDHEYRRFVRLTAGLVEQVPLYLVRGNHETMAPDGSFTDHYLRYIDPAHYSFEHGGHLFCVFDNSAGSFGTTQLRAMRATIERFRSTHPTRSIFAFMHMPPDLPGLDSPDMGDGASADVLALASEHRVAAIFAGHLHDYHEERVGETRLIVSGCGGGSIRAPSTDVHYVEVTVDSGGFATRRVPIARESRLMASASYSVGILVPRYRWVVVGGALALLACEAGRGWYALRRRRSVAHLPSNEAAPRVAGASPAGQS